MSFDSSPVLLVDYMYLVFILDFNAVHSYRSVSDLLS